MEEKSVECPSPAGTHQMVYHAWGEATAPLVICVHGLTRNSRDFDVLANHLAVNGYRVIAPDIVGRGRSDWLPNPALYNYGQYCSDVLVLLAALGATEVRWVGTSMGGLLGMMLAAQPQSPITRLVLNDVGPFIPAAALTRLARYVGQDPAFATLAELEAYLRQIHAPFGQLTEADWQHMARHSHRVLPDGRYALAYDPAITNVFTTVPMPDVNLWPVYDAVRCPTLLLRGASSDLLLPETALEMSQRGPQAALVTIPEAGHAPGLVSPMEISVIENFLKG